MCSVLVSFSAAVFRKMKKTEMQKTVKMPALVKEKESI